MRYITLIIVFSLINKLTFCQTEISGKIIDIEKNTVPFATVKLISLPDSNTISMSASDTSGCFDIKISEEDIRQRYVLKISMIEYRDTQFMIAPINMQKRIDLGEIIISQNSLNLDGAIVTAGKKLIERKIDRLVFNVENSISSQGRTLLDLLARTPLVLVQNRSISVMGKGGVFILLNDKMLYLTGEELAGFLEAIPSEDVQKIEVITNPPAKYDAVGSVLINVVTKKSKLPGTNGNVTASYTQAYYPTGRMGGSINHRRKKINMYGTLNARAGANKFIEKTDYYYLSANNHQVETTLLTNNTIRSSIGFDYYAKKSTLSGTFENIDIIRSSEGASSLDYTGVFNSSDSSLITSSESKNMTIYNAANLNYQVNIDTTGRKINLNINYLTNNNELNNAFSSQTNTSSSVLSSSEIRSRSEQLINIISSNIDYELPGGYVDWELGAKFNWINNKNTNTLSRVISNVIQNDSLQNQELIYNEITEALYISGHKSFDKIECKIGLRAENTHLDGHVPNSNLYQISRQFLNLFPTMYFLYRINDKSSLSLTYSKRIDRPNYYSLNPMRKYLAPTIYRQGNPFLRPTYMNEAELNYTLPNNYIVGLIYTNFTNSYMELPTQTGPGSFAYLQNNIGNTNQYGGMINIPFSIQSRIETSVMLIVIYSVFQPTFATYSRSETMILFGNVNTSYYLDKNKRFAGDISLVTRPFGSIYTLSNMGAQYILNLGWKMKILKNMGFVTLTVNDVFRNSVPKSSITANAFIIETNNYYDTRSLVAAFSYKFGNKFIKSRMSRDKGNEEEKNRIQ